MEPMPNSPSTQCIDAARLSMFLEERLDETAEAEIQAHVDECPHCRASLENVAGAPELWRDLRDHLSGVSAASKVTDEAEVDGLAELTALLDPSEDPRYLGRIGVYEICGLIGRGTTGLVLKAHEPRLGRYVALKLMLPGVNANGSARQRFEREGRAVAAVSNEHVVPVHAVDEHRGLPYIVMKYVPGPSLEQRLERQGALGMAEVVRIGLQVAEGLAAAHAQGIVHRDVKPANVILEDTIDRAMVTDFGLARVLDEVTMTKSGTISGTPQYMSPEQARGDSVDPRSDLFSLGSLLYAACTGRPPFRAENLFGVIHRVCETEPRAMREVNPGIEPWLAAFVGKLMRKEPSQRFQSAEEVARLLRAELAHLQNPTVAAEPPRDDWWTTDVDERPEPRRSPKWLAWAGGFALLAAGGWALEGTERGRQWRASVLPTLTGWFGAAEGSIALGERWTRDVVDTEQGEVVVYQQELVEAFPIGGAGRLQLNVSDGDVDIVPGAEGRIVVTAKRQVAASDQDAARGALEAFDLELLHVQDELQLRASRPALPDEQPTAREHESAQYRVEVPRSADLDLSVSAGVLSLGMLSGDVRVDVQSGALHVAPLEGTLKAHTASADVFFDGGFEGQGEIYSDLGHLHLTHIDGDLAVRARQGHVFRDGGRGPLDIETDGGDVFLTDCGGDGDVLAVRGNVEVKGATGSVSVLTSGGDVKLGSNTGAVTVQTSGGNVSVAAADGPVSVFASLGDVDARIGSAPAGLVFLSAKRGDVRLNIADDVPAVLVAQGEVLGDFDFEERTNDAGEQARVCELNGGTEQIRLASSSGRVIIESVAAVDSGGLSEVNDSIALGGGAGGPSASGAAAGRGPAEGATSPGAGSPSGPAAGAATPGSSSGGGLGGSSSGGSGSLALGSSLGGSSAGLGGSGASPSASGGSQRGAGVSLGGSATGLGGSSAGLGGSNSGLGGSNPGRGGSNSGLGGSGPSQPPVSGLGGSASAGGLQAPAPPLTPDGQLRTSGEPRPGALATVTLEEPRGNIDGYTLYLPIGHATFEGRYPVLLYLQGAFGVGGEIEAVNPWGLTRLLRDETDLTLERNRLLLDGFIVINLHITGGQYDAHPEVVDAILDDVMARYKGDPARVSVSGLSRGGHGAWGLASKLPGRFAAVVPIGGNSNHVVDYAALSDVSVWIGHNADDRVVEFEQAEAAIAQIEAATSVEFLRLEPRELPIAPYLQHSHVLTSAPFGGHDAWTELYTSPEFYRWLLEQRRPQDGETSDS